MSKIGCKKCDFTGFAFSKIPCECTDKAFEKISKSSIDTIFWKGDVKLIPLIGADIYSDKNGYATLEKTEWYIGKCVYFDILTRKIEIRTNNGQTIEMLLK